MLWFQYTIDWSIYRNPSIISGITCLQLPEQACIQLVTGPLHCRNCGKAFSSPKCELSYRFLPWNPEMENFVGAPTGIEPASPAFQAGGLTTTPQHPGTKNIKFASSNHPWRIVLPLMLLLLQCFYTVRVLPTISYGHHSSDQLMGSKPSAGVRRRGREHPELILFKNVHQVLTNI